MIGLLRNIEGCFMSVPCYYLLAHPVGTCMPAGAYKCGEVHAQALALLNDGP
jgi:hypothetical protein